MFGYKQDKYGNFHPVDVPDLDSDRRAQGSGASAQTQAVLQAIGNGASVKTLSDGAINVSGNMPGQKTPISWHIRPDGSGTIQPRGSGVTNLGPGTYQPNIILAAQKGGSSSESPQTKAVIKVIDNNATVNVLSDGAINVSGNMPGQREGLSWHIRPDGSGTITPHRSGAGTTNLGPGTYQPRLILDAYHRRRRPGPGPTSRHDRYDHFGPAVFGTPVLPPPPTLSGIALQRVPGTLSGIPAAGGYGQVYARRPLSFAVPAVGGIDPTLLEILLQEIQAQGAEDTLLLSLLEKIESTGLASAAQSSGIDLQSVLTNAGMTLDAAGLPVPAGYVGTDGAGADLYADGGVDPTGGGLGDYSDPRSQ